MASRPSGARLPGSHDSLDANPKPVFWVGSAGLPGGGSGGHGVRALESVARRTTSPGEASQGDRARAGVLEVVERHDGDTYRVVYTVRFKDAGYVLPAFQKKSKRGIKTPKHDIEVIRQRLKAAEGHHGRRQK